MKKSRKNIKNLLLVVSVLILCFSVTAFATEEEQVPENITEPEVTDPEIIEHGIIDLEKDGDYVIEIQEDAVLYLDGEVRPEVKLYYVRESEDGEEIKIEINDECYTVEYLDNTSAGTATVNVSGVEEKGYCGTISNKFTVVPKSMEDAEICLFSEKLVYTGKEIQPGMTVYVDTIQLIPGVDYTVTYKNNVKVGTATITVEGKGIYEGTKTIDFAIALGKTSVSTVPEYNKIKISWTKVTGAAGYELLRSTNQNSGYKVIAQGSSLSYTDTNVKFNTTYYYIVRSYCTVDGKKVYSDNSAVKAQKVQVATPVISKITRKSSSSLQVTWNKVSGATGYTLYRSTTEKGTYTRVATISDAATVSYTNKNLSCTTTYYYKVRAYRKVNGTNYFGTFSRVVSGYTVPSKVTWNAAAITDESITLKWNKVSEASGYEIYRSDVESGPYARIATITTNSTLSYKDANLVKGKTYYYKIRAYKTKGEEKIYGPYSDFYTKGVAGWKYENGYKLYYNASGKLVKDVSNIIGKQSSYVIKVNKQKNTVTVYAKDGSNGYIIPVKAFVCSTGNATPLGTFYTPQKYRWHTLDGPSYGQWCTRIYKGFLFHSVWYYQPKNTTLSVEQYNKLGTTASHGCVRLTAGDAKWIYDNCALNTKVVIYNSSTSGPFGKPTADKLPSWHTWDPTDPNVKSKCEKKGCH